MRKTLLFALMVLSVFVAACDNGEKFPSTNVSSNLKITVERQNSVDINESLTVYAMDFHKEGYTLTFVCPCYIAGYRDYFLNVRVEGDSFKLTALPGAEYEVRVVYWNPDSDKNTSVTFHISRENTGK